jgi:hypothetical protein
MKLFELKPPRDGMRPMTTHETTVALLFGKRNHLTFGSGRVDDKTGAIHVSYSDARGNNVSHVINL